MSVSYDDLISSILKYPEECGKSGWDGEEETPVSIKTANNAAWFLEQMKDRHDIVPDACPERDGDIEVEWYFDKNNRISISVGVERIIYVGRIGGTQVSGSHPIDISAVVSIDAVLFRIRSGILPLLVTQNGLPHEPVLESIVCESISGGANYVNNMPAELTLRRTLRDGTVFVATYTQKR